MIDLRARCLAILFVTVGCETSGRSPPTDLRAPAERYFTGVYGCRSDFVDELTADSITISYPAFQRLFGRPAIRGREAVKEFADRFCGRWSDPEITFHETLQDGSRVVLLWEFRAVATFNSASEAAEVGTPQSWGGISYVRFDEAGKVVAEIGEESSPGPIARVAR